jgi:hypothetical protein
VRPSAARQQTTPGRTRIPTDFSENFHKGNSARPSPIIELSRSNHRDNQASTPDSNAFRATACTKSGHTLVERLHSVARKRDIRPRFSLTLKMKGVKTNSFFDAFLSLPGWCGVRGSSVVTLRIAR